MNSTNKPATDFIEFIRKTIDKIVKENDKLTRHEDWLRRYCKVFELDLEVYKTNINDYLEILSEYTKSSTPILKKMASKLGASIHLAEHQIEEHLRSGYKQETLKKDKNAEIKWIDNKYGIYVDPRDNEQYRVVKIGKQVWMAEDLRFAHKYANKFFSYPKNGLYYETLDDVQAVCPGGWKVPSRNDFQELIDALGGPEEAGRALKSVTDWEIDPGEDIKDSLGTNESGFNAYPMMDDKNNDFMYGYWWTTTPYENIKNAIAMFCISPGNVLFDRYDLNESISLLRLRCILM